ncbi:MAG: ABC transporter permease, partial [Ignavibacteriales bacterium]|nr:ABC transporter permease [Ignavibacteriales bacterium]
MEFTEIIKISLAAIKANKLRSTLTLLGIVVGVFSIIGVMTAVQVLQSSIENGLSALGAHTFQIQKMPNFFTGGPSQWQKFRNRKDITFDQAQLVSERLTTSLYTGIEAFDGGNIVQTNSFKTNPNVQVMGETPEGIPTNNWVIKEGRAFNDNDYKHSTKVVVLGQEVVKKVFPNGGAVGAEVRIRSERYTVVGVFDPQGASLGGNNDNFVAIPLSTFLNVYGKEHRSLNIMVKAKNAD